MTVILPALKSNNLIFDILVFRRLHKSLYHYAQPQQKGSKQSSFALQTLLFLMKFLKIDFRWKNLEKLASLQTLKFPIIIDLNYNTDKLDQYVDVYPNSFFKI